LSDFSQVQFIDIDENYAGQRVDNFLFHQLKGVPKSRVYRIIRKGEVRVNKKRVKAEYKLLAGDQLRIPPIKVAQPKEPVPIDKFEQVKQLEQAIIHECNQYILLNKPSGIAVHGGSGISFGVIEGLRAIRPKEKFLELVHRLDRDTSGCLLVAKRRSYLMHFQQQLRQREMQKVYLAIVSGVWDNQNNRVVEPLLKKQAPSGERYVIVNQEGKPSETNFKCLKQFEQQALIKAMPKTGRTHQIRVHAQYAGCPLLGDEKYGLYDEEVELMKQLKTKSFFLHAHKLTFTVPDSETLITFEAPIPDKMNQAIEYFKKN
jgi:23S rRNA pseudouridine955/2504/2580 synthase